MDSETRKYSCALLVTFSSIASSTPAAMCRIRVKKNRAQFDGELAKSGGRILGF